MTDPSSTRWSSDADRAAWRQEAQTSGAQLATQKRDEFLDWLERMAEHAAAPKQKQEKKA